MQPEQYWKIKAVVLERQMLDQQIKVAQQQAALKVAQVLAEAGLDPAANYTMDDETQTITAASAKPQLAVDNSSEV